MKRQMSETQSPDQIDLPDTFEKAVAELESIGQSMESGSLALEQSLAAYRRGAALAAHCRRLLTEVQQQVRVLEADLLKPFEADTQDP
jgi:exodeoxyribonuclease VII small subunit